MAEYMMLLKLTREGAAKIDGVADFMQELVDEWNVLGGPAAAYMVMGEYDFVLHGSAKSDEDVAWFAAQIARAGDAMPHTMRSYSTDEVRRIFEDHHTEPLRVFHEKT